VGDGTFGAATGFPTGTLSKSVTAGDLNGDGKLDLALVNQTDNTVSILLGNGDGSFQPKVDYATGSTPSSVSATDLNGDGMIDLVVVNSGGNTVSVLLGNGDGTFQTQTTFATPASPFFVTTGDFNGDGKFDLAVANLFDNTVSVLLQAPVAALSSPSLLFGNQLLGTTSGTQSVTLTNTGSANLAITTVVLGGADRGDFARKL